MSARVFLGREKWQSIIISITGLPLKGNTLLIVLFDGYHDYCTSVFT